MMKLKAGHSVTSIPEQCGADCTDQTTTGRKKPKGLSGRTGSEKMRKTKRQKTASGQRPRTKPQVTGVEERNEARVKRERSRQRGEKKVSSDIPRNYNKDKDTKGGGEQR